MTKVLEVVAVAGSLHRPSRTEVLLSAIVAELAAALPIRTRFIHLSGIGAQVGGALARADLPPNVFNDVKAIEAADLLVVATPVYRGSYTGLFKHLFDFVGYEAIIDLPVLLAATGGSERHSLMIDHQLRPLFSFFQALTLPIGVYGSEADFTDYRITSPALTQRIALAVNRALPYLDRPLPRQQPRLRQPFLAQL
jgi:FMN reductase